jgi:hypothetical protein
MAESLILARVVPVMTNWYRLCRDGAWAMIGRKDGLRRMELRSLLAACLLTLTGATVPGPAPAETKRIFAIPATQWDNAMSTERPSGVFGPSDLGNLTGGIVFGLSPSAVNARLPTPTPGVEWADLPFASEYPGDVRYFWVRLDAIRDLGNAATDCVGANSYVVFLFRNRALFRVSWRLLPDKDCPSPRAAAEAIYGRYLVIDRSVSLATHYHAGKAEAVEITDPGADDLVPYRWTNRQRR